MSNTETMHAAFTAWVEREVPAWKYWGPNEQLAARSGFYAASAGKAELLEALKLCAAVCAGETMNKNGLIYALEKARAAISRATGEQDTGRESND